MSQVLRDLCALHVAATDVPAMEQVWSRTGPRQGKDKEQDPRALPFLA